MSRRGMRVHSIAAVRRGPGMVGFDRRRCWQSRRGRAPVEPGVPMVNSSTELLRGCQPLSGRPTADFNWMACFADWLCAMFLSGCGSACSFTGRCGRLGQRGQCWCAHTPVWCWRTHAEWLRPVQCCEELSISTLLQQVLLQCTCVAANTRNRCRVPTWRGFMPTSLDRSCWQGALMNACQCATGVAEVDQSVVGLGRAHPVCKGCMAGGLCMGLQMALCQM
jgi:hypothetical protein